MKNRPGTEVLEAAQKPGSSECSMSPTTDLVVELDAIAEALRGYIVVQVVINDEGHRRTHLYRSAAAAERAVGRARQRGRDVHVSLCQLMPVGVVVGLGGQR